MKSIPNNKHNKLFSFKVFNPNVKRRTKITTMNQGNKGKNKDEYKIERLQAFNKETIKLREPNKELNPAKCKENNIKSIQEEFIIERGT